MNDDKSRRSILKAIGASTAAGLYAEGVEAQERLQNGFDHSVPYDLQVINNGQAGRRISVKFIRLGSKEMTEEALEFDVTPLNDPTLNLVEPPVENIGLDIGKGEYRLVVSEPSGNSANMLLTVPEGGIQDHSTIIVSRRPDNSFYLSHTLV